MEKNYSHLLELTLEIEGLLSLLEQGHSQRPERVQSMLTEKISVLAESFDLLKPADASVEDNAAADIEQQDEEIAAAANFEQMDDADPFDADDDIPFSQPTDKPATTPVEVPPPPVAAPKSTDDDANESENDEITTVIVDEPEGDDEDNAPINDGFDDADDAPATSGMKLDEKLAIDSSREIRRAFTLNDRFRFRRELFENSEARFVEALDVISAMSSYAEAEEYFYDDLCWDPESDDVKDFMLKVYNHFR